MLHLLRSISMHSQSCIRHSDGHQQQRQSQKCRRLGRRAAWGAALCLLLLWQLPAEASRTASAHRVPRQRALKTSAAAAAAAGVDASSQLKSSLNSQALNRSIDNSTSTGVNSSSGTQPGGSSSKPSSLQGGALSSPGAKASQASINGAATSTLAATPPANRGSSEAAWLNVSLEFPSNAKAPHNYAEAVHKSLLFYWAQRSGPMPVKRLAWRSDSCLECVGQFGEVRGCTHFMKFMKMHACPPPKGRASCRANLFPSGQSHAWNASARVGETGLQVGVFKEDEQWYPS